jgi:hypothetical protein
MGAADAMAHGDERIRGTAAGALASDAAVIRHLMPVLAGSIPSRD